MQDEPDGLGTPLRPGQREQLEKCPPEVRPALRKLYDRVFYAHGAHQERSRLRVAVLKLRQKLESTITAAEAAPFREELRMSEMRLSEANLRCAEIDREVSKASAEYAQRLHEWRLRGIPAERLEEAQAILREEAQALDKARLANQGAIQESLLGMQTGTAAEAHLTISRTLGESEKLRLRKISDDALDSAAHLDAIVADYKERCDAIREEHNLRLRALADEEQP